MKAAVSARYGSPDVIELREVPRPERKATDVLIKVHATTVTRTDDGMLRPHPFFIRLSTGLLSPKCTTLGMDFAGTVEAIGADVTSFEPGERVFGISPNVFGAHAEYLCVHEQGQIATMPVDARFDEVVVCEGAWYAYTCLNKMGLKPSHKILIYGASGAIGTAAVQLAKFYGADVTAVVATRHLDLAKSLGADRVIDYTVEGLRQVADTFDCMLDAVGKTTFFQCRKLLKPSAIFAATDLGPWWQNILLELWSSVTGSNRVVIPLPKISNGFVDFLKARMEAGEFRAVVDRHYPFDEIADAYRYVETGQKTGIVVIDIMKSGKD